MATSKKTDLIKNIKIIAGNSDINSFYNKLKSGIIEYFSDKQSLYENETRNIFNNVFKGTISKSETEILLKKSLEPPIYNNPYVAYFLSNLSNNKLINLLTTGILNDEEPLAGSLSVFQQATGKTNLQSAIKFVRDNQFGCTFSYPNYKKGEITQLNFNLSLNPKIIGQTLGLIIFVNNQNISPDDARFLSNLIKSYSNTTTFITGNAYGIQAQSTISYNFDTFENLYLESVDKFQISTENNSIRNGTDNAPESIPQRPRLTDENFIIKNEDDVTNPFSLTSPKNITLNQFSQPDSNEILSILDIIRKDEFDEDIKATTNIIIDGNVFDENGELFRKELGKELTPESPEITASPESTKISRVSKTSSITMQELLNLMKPAEKTHVKIALNDKINSENEILKNLEIQKTRLIKSQEFIVTCFIGGIANQDDMRLVIGGSMGGGVVVTVPMEQLREYYIKLSTSLQNDSESSKESDSVLIKIQNAKWKDVKTLKTINRNLLIRLDIYNEDYDPQISKETIDKVFKKSNNSPPPIFVRVVGEVNKVNTEGSNYKINAICQDVLTEVRSIEQERLSTIALIEKIKSDLREFGEEYTEP